MRPARPCAICLSAAVIFIFGCRQRSKSSIEAQTPVDDKQLYKLVATCASESPDAQFKSLLIQEDQSTMRALLLMNNGEKSDDTVSFFNASVVTESRNEVEIRKLYQAEKFTVTLELERKGTDTFEARVKNAGTKPDVVYSCAM